MKSLLRLLLFICFGCPLLSYGQNLIVNGDAENGSAGWTIVSGQWGLGTEVTAKSGSYHFFAGTSSPAELYQDIDVSSYATSIDAGIQQFNFTGYVQNWKGLDASRIIIQYRDGGGTILDTYDSGNLYSDNLWLPESDSRFAPANTRTIRIRLLSTKNDGADNDGYYDDLSLTTETVIPPSVGLVADIHPNSDGVPIGFIVYRGNLYFSADDGTHGVELWMYDGDTTTLVADINPSSSASSEPSDFAIYNDKLYFAAHNGTNGRELMVYDGSSVTLAQDIYVGSSSSSPSHLIVFQGQLYFQATNGSNGFELWRYNGTSASLAVDIYPGSNSSLPSQFAVYKDQLYFSATNGGFVNNELWRYNGTSASLVADIVPGTNGGSFPKSLVVYKEKLYFSASPVAFGRGDLWVHDGVSTTRVFDFNPGGVNDLTIYNGKLYYASNNGTGDELYSYNGSSVALAAEISPGGSFSGPFSSKPLYLAVYENVLYFQASESPATGDELWSFDGTSASLTADILADVNSSSPNDLTVYKDKLLFQARGDLSTGFELWEYGSPTTSNNLLSNSSAESGIGNWTQASGGEWRPRHNSQGLTAADGENYFYPGSCASGELYQDIDVAHLATDIDASLQEFAFSGYVQSGGNANTRIVVEYRDATGSVLNSYDSGDLSSIGAWQILEDTLTAPANTRMVRVRLISTRTSGTINNGYFDDLILTTYSTAALPVELIQFTGQNTERGNLLQWVTASEENNAGFEVQKSSNGRDFETIGYVEGHGTTFQLQHYAFLDENVSTSIAYYRLKQLDTDGQYEYTEIISLQAQARHKQAVSIYPNPVSHTLYIEEGQGMASLFNALGQCVLQVRIVDARHALNLEELRQGVYTLHLQLDKGGVFTQQVVK